MASQFYLNWSDSTNVSTLTTLMPFLRVDPYVTVSVHLQNLDATNSVDLIVDPSAGGTLPNISRRQTYTAGPGEEVSIEFGAPMWARSIRISAQTESPGFPVVPVRWCILGKTPQTP